MKNLTVILLILLIGVSALISCKKTQNVTAQTPTIIAHWSLVRDSMVAPSVGGPISRVYKGVQTDYFNFSSDGSFTVNEGPYGLSTGNYSILTDSTVRILANQNGTQVYYGGNGVFKVESLTDHKLTLYSWAAIPGAGVMSETLILSK
ncbi:MAG: hypothetical protein ACXVB6_06430 [Mucilaginibacter sp.]